jgi:hypothetical protein
MSKIKLSNPKRNEVVRIRFKTLDKILDDSGLPFSEADDQLAIGRNIRAVLQGGDFVVSEPAQGNDSDKFGQYITIKNHFDHDYEFDVHDIVLESIQIIDDPIMFSSQEMNLMVVRVGDEMFINGSPLIGDELENEQDHHRYGKNKGVPYENKNRKLLSIFENFIADIAVKDSLSHKKGVDK